jgi:hypothetical protein
MRCRNTEEYSSRLRETGFHQHQRTGESLHSRAARTFGGVSDENKLVVDRYALPTSLMYNGFLLADGLFERLLTLRESGITARWQTGTCTK